MSSDKKLSVETITKLFKKAKIHISGVNYYETSNSDYIHYVYDERLNVLLGENSKKFTQRLNTNLRGKFLEVDGRKFLVIYKSKNFQPQFLNGVFDKVKNLATLMGNIKSGVNTIFTREFFMFVFDLIRMILDIRDGWFTGSKILSTLMSLYSLFDRAKHVASKYRAQIHILNDVNFDTLLLMFSAIGVPKVFLDTMKTFTDLTGRKLFNSELILTIITTFYDLLKQFITWMCHTIPNLESFGHTLNNILDYLFSTIVCYNKIKEVVTLYSKYIKDASIILDPKFRIECEELYSKLKGDVNFMEYIGNVDNKHFRTTWDGFCNNLMKYIKNFDVSRREEPICIVLEGSPGCGKSVLMNNIVEYLVRINKSVYVHTVPPVAGGKDFYDDYENQDVFVMDDVGQQGASQWRTIINFVAPIKYPLECAEAKKKCTKFFNSKYIIVTTNKFTGLNSFTNSDCISEPGALFRRAHVLKISKGSSPTGKHTNDFQYMKYDYKDKNVFVNEFLYHNQTDKINPRAEGLSTLEGLMYVMSIFKHLEKTEEANRQSSVLSEDMFKEVDDYLNNLDNNYSAQFKVSDYFTMLKQSLSTYFLGSDIFDEWFDSIKSRVNSFIAFMCSFITTLFGSDNEAFADEIRILNAQNPYTVLNVNPTSSAQDVIKSYRALSLRFHPDKAAPEFRELHSIIMRILNSARNAILNNTEFLNDTDDYIIHGLRDSGYISAMKFKDSIFNSYLFIKSLPYKLYQGFFELPDDLRIQLAVSAIYLGVMISAVLFDMISDAINSYDSKDLWDKQTSENVEHLGTTGVKDMVLTDTTINVVKKSVRFVTGIRTDGTSFFSQAVVGGRFILLNSHTNVDKGVINIYNTYDHYLNKHIEQESVTVEKVRDYPSVDLCVYRMINVTLVYKAPRTLFTNVSEIKPFMYLVSSMGIIPMIAGKHFESNKEDISYTSYGVHYKHRINSGLLTNVQGDGLCGTIMVNPHGGIVGVHVAGDGVSGFCVTPNPEIIDSINSYLTSEANLAFDVDTTIRENFSGVRLRYEKDEVKVSHVGGDVPMVPSLLHRDYNEETKKLIGLIHTDETDFYSSVPDKLINNRKPPNLTSRPAEKLKETSKKAFKLQGFVKDDELDYIGKCIGAIMPEQFTDISFQEAAFGGELAAMAKDTSNGYDHVREKSLFFDFENKVITDYGRKEFEDFKERIEMDKPILKDFLSKEVFKVNELRNEEKADKPRTIRVMPVTHIFWTKVICGEVALHFKKFMHETGVCIGFNPYKDFHQLTLNLKDKAIVGDADYGSWDGTLNARIMFKIFEIFKERYRGKYMKILDFLSTSIVRSMVLVSDELYATTHGMPSGTWLTLLLNCLVNKAIQALTIFRNKEQPTVQDFLDVVSYVTGDDDVFGTPEHLTSVFNLQTLKDTAESLGMTCTNGDKTVITTKGQDFAKLNYLKRHFRFHPVLNRYMGCLSLSTIMNTFQYVDGTKNYDEAMSGKINAVLVESYIHSPALYMLMSDYFKRQCPQYKQLDEKRVIKILSDDDGYLEILKSLGKNYANL